MTKKWNKEKIQGKLKEQDSWVIRGLIAIYKKQTIEEQKREDTVENNGVGFNGSDARFLTSLAKQAIQRGNLSPKQMQYGRKKVMKYAGQLAKIANGTI